MSCPDIEELIAFALAEGNAADSDVAEHVIGCPECRKNLEMVHETLLAEEWKNPETQFLESAEPGLGFYSWGDLRFDPPEMVVTLAEIYAGRRMGDVRWGGTLSNETRAGAMSGHASTRALGDAPAEVPSRFSFVKRGDECSLKIELEILSAGATVSLSMIAPTGEPVSPFTLSVMDAESREILLDSREFKVGEAVLRGVKKGVYLVKAEGCGRSCRFSFQVE